MSCEFCTTYQESSTRAPEGRFCFQTREIVDENHEPCDNFGLHNEFWCPKTNCWLSVPMCTARQNKLGLYPDCIKCSKARNVLEIKRFAGRVTLKKLNQLSDLVPKPKKKIIIRRTT